MSDLTPSEQLDDPGATGFFFSDECDLALAEAVGWAAEARSIELEPQFVLLALLADRTPARVAREPVAASLLLSSLAVPVDKLTELLIDVYLGTTESEGPGTRPQLGDGVHQILLIARSYAEQEFGPDAAIWSAHVLAALLDASELNLPVLNRLREADITAATVLARWRTDRKRLMGRAAPVADESESAHNPFATNLTAMAAAGELDPVIGREKEISRLITILCRRSKNNPVLIGSPGVGKTSVVEGLAQRIIDGKVPERLREARIMALSTAKLVAGTKYRGQFEARVGALIEELRSQPKTIVFIDEIHSIVGAGSGGFGDGNDFANMLKPALARGELHCVGATTLDEYRRYIEKDAALERRFAPLLIEEPDEEATRAILDGLAPRYAAHHGVSYHPTALDACVRLAGRHLASRHFPDKAIDLLDEVGSRVAGVGRSEVTASDVNALVSEIIGLDGSELDAATVDDGRLDRLLAQRVIGQPQATELVAGQLRLRRMIRRRRQTNQRGPLASFALVGPDGVGKSTIAHAVADTLFDGRITEVDLSNYAEAHAISGLIGAPPGYVGYGERARLVEPLRTSPSQVMLLKHIDLAHPVVRALLVDLMRSGEISDSTERKASYHDAVLFITLTGSGAANIGFGSRSSGASLNAIEAARTQLRKAVGDELADLFDAVVPLAALDETAIVAIRDARLDAIIAELAHERIDLALAPRLSEAVLAMARPAGARGVKRAIEHLVEQPLAAGLPTSPSRRVRRLLLDYKDGHTVLGPAPRAPRTRPSPAETPANRLA